MVTLSTLEGRVAKLEAEAKRACSRVFRGVVTMLPGETAEDAIARTVPPGMVPGSLLVVPQVMTDDEWAAMVAEMRAGHAGA
jgi:hypothetical protein